MQTQLSNLIKDTPAGLEAEAIIGSCVHCGFCNATCPTYQLLGNELDGPRGRIYLIKQMLEGKAVSEKTQTHLDRCLSCRSCETTCPSGVKYHRLLDIGRQVLAQSVPRHWYARLMRFVLAEGVPRTALFIPALKLGQWLRPILPAALARKVPASAKGKGGLKQSALPVVAVGAGAPRRMLALAGCAQPALTPNTNAATRRVLARLGIEMIESPAAGCCGALRYHLSEQEKAFDDMRRVIDAWWPAVERGEIEAIVMTASGCGAQVREYGELLQHDVAYAAKAEKISALTRDVSEILAAEHEALLALVASLPKRDTETVAFHAPCTLQHGQKVRGVAESVLRAAGYTLTPVADAHLCCGSAGTYSVLQPLLSKQLRANKLAALQAGEPAHIVSANVGCQTHLQGACDQAVRHWVELIDERINY